MSFPLRSRDTSVGIARGLTAGVQLPVGTRMFLFSTGSRPTPEPIQLMRWVRGNLSSGGKAAGAWSWPPQVMPGTAWPYHAWTRRVNTQMNALKYGPLFRTNAFITIILSAKKKRHITSNDLPYTERGWISICACNSSVCVRERSHKDEPLHNS
jgi:hypothetical protein